MTDAALSFPTNVEEFANDERISYSRLSNKYIAVHDDGSEFEFHPELKRWIIAADDEPNDAGFPADDDLDLDARPDAPSKKRKSSATGDEVSGSAT